MCCPEDCLKNFKTTWHLQPPYPVMCIILFLLAALIYTLYKCIKIWICWENTSFSSYGICFVTIKTLIQHQKIIGLPSSHLLWPHHNESLTQIIDFMLTLFSSPPVTDTRPSLIQRPNKSQFHSICTEFDNTLTSELFCGFFYSPVLLLKLLNRFFWMLRQRES